MLYENSKSLSELLVNFMKIPQRFADITKGESFKDIEREDFTAANLKVLIPELEQDDVGNLYLINEGTPLFCAHMDTVGSAEAQLHVDKIAYTGINLLSVKDTTSYKEWSAQYDLDNPINPEDLPEVRTARKVLAANEEVIMGVMGTHNIGADDKCGIALAYALRQEFGNKISLLFTRGEETGMHGVRHFTQNYKTLLDKCTYCILGDRRNGKDLICNVHSSKYGSKEFETKVLEQIGEFGFKSVEGGGSDMNHIKSVLNGFNISVGYYYPHTDNEIVISDEFYNTYQALHKLITNFNEKLEPAVEKGFSRGGPYNTPVKKGAPNTGSEWDKPLMQSNKRFTFKDETLVNIWTHANITDGISFYAHGTGLSYYLPEGMISYTLVKNASKVPGCVLANCINLPAGEFTKKLKDGVQPATPYYARSTTEIDSYADRVLTLTKDLVFEIDSNGYWSQKDGVATNYGWTFTEIKSTNKYYIPKGTYSVTSIDVADLHSIELEYMKELYTGAPTYPGVNYNYDEEDEAITIYGGGVY